jgi:hypothetical protein
VEPLFEMIRVGNNFSFRFNAVGGPPPVVCGIGLWDTVILVEAERPGRWWSADGLTTSKNGV